MSETESEADEFEEESLAKDLESLRELLESEPTTSHAAQFKHDSSSSPECGGATLDHLNVCLQKNREFQSSLSHYLMEIETALQLNRKKKMEVESRGRDYIRTICTLHKVKLRHIYFIDNKGKSPYMPLAVNPPCLNRNYYFHDNKWSEHDDFILEQHVRAQAVEVANRPYEDQLQRTSDSTEIQSLKGKMRDRNSGEILKDLNLDDILWENVAYEGFKKKRTACDCRQRWANFVSPLVKTSPWTKEEERIVIKEAKKTKGREWKKILDTLGTERTAFSCFKVYQNTFKKEKKNSWTKEWDSKLSEGVEKFGDDNWIMVSRFVGRSANACRSRWQLFLSPQIKKGRWSTHEDKQLVDAVSEFGIDSAKCWKRISGRVPTRSGSQCRERWVNVLSPDVNTSPFTDEENMKLIGLCAEYESKGVPIAWAKVALQMPSRTDSRCQAQWHRLAPQTQVQRNCQLSKMKEKLMPKVSGKKALALDFNDFDEDMIPEDVKEVARNYSASVIKKRAGRVSSSPTLTLPNNPFPVGPHSITGIVNAPGASSSGDRPMYVLPLPPLSVALGMAASSSLTSSRCTVFAAPALLPSITSSAVFQPPQTSTVSAAPALLPSVMSSAVVQPALTSTGSTSSAAPPAIISSAAEARSSTSSSTPCSAATLPIDATTKAALLAAIISHIAARTALCRSSSGHHVPTTTSSMCPFAATTSITRSATTSSVACSSAMSSITRSAATSSVARPATTPSVARPTTTSSITRSVTTSRSAAVSSVAQSIPTSSVVCPMVTMSVANASASTGSQPIILSRHSASVRGNIASSAQIPDRPVIHRSRKSKNQPMSLAGSTSEQSPTVGNGHAERLAPPPSKRRKRVTRSSTTTK